ncbi:uncharacterized protein [Dermacentor andersoni]|uniref:uncharacterized protein n=1 Tax=Dermacentor andersoni TaxID=34620 RepID=UPI003B3AC6E2
MADEREHPECPQRTASSGRHKYGNSDTTWCQKWDRPSPPPSWLCGAHAAFDLRNDVTAAAAPPAAIPPPTPFNFDRTSEWPEWIMSFDDYRYASGLNDRTEAAQVRMFLYTMGRQARKHFQTFGLTEEESRSYETVKKKFDAHFVATKNIVYQSANFHRRKQQPGESADNFVTALPELADHSQFAEFWDRMIRDRFVVGLEDAQLSEALQMDATLTLATTLVRARLKETVHRQQLELRAVSNEANTGELDAVRRTTRKPSNNWEPGTTAQRRTQACQFCGRSSHPRARCHARSARCDHCGIKGHFAVVCNKITENNQASARQKNKAADQNSPSTTRKRARKGAAHRCPLKRPR